MNAGAAGGSSTRTDVDAATPADVNASRPAEVVAATPADVNTLTSRTCGSDVKVLTFGLARRDVGDHKAEAPQPRRAVR